MAIDPDSGRTPTGAPHVTRLTESDWRTFAELRLQALTETLGTDDSQYRQEISFTAAQWRRRLRAHAQFVATIDDNPVGLIGAQRETVESVYLYSLWLDPKARGRGLATALLSAAIEWARGERARTVTLRVNTANVAARGVYEQFGFNVLGVGTTGRPDELTMSLRVD